MPTKYWYKAANGSDNWSVASNWYLGSGGTGGTTTVPGSGDDVILDANSGSGTITIAATATIRSLVATTFTGTLTGSSLLQVTGSNSGAQGSGVSIELGTGMTYSLSGGITMSAITSSGSINFNGKSHSTGTIIFNGASGLWTLAGNLTTTGQVTLNTGSLTTNNFNITCSLFSGTGTSTRSLSLGSSIITCTVTSGVFWSFATTTGLTFNAGTSTIRYNAIAASTITFAGGSLTYYNVELIRGSSTAQLTVTGNNTYYNFIDATSTAAHTIAFTTGSTQTFENFNVRGSSGTARILLAGSAGATVNFVKTGAGAVTVDYLNLSTNITSVTPANIWYAGYNSIGTGSGWILRNPTGLLTMGVGG